jgi:alpha-glucosidase (family GH31 glycosyl hydrolase)
VVFYCRLAAGYYIKDGFNKTALVKWWHGEGAFLDFSSSSALLWWQQQEDLVLKLGVDGWKLDGSECRARIQGKIVLALFFMTVSLSRFFSEMQPTHI